MSDNFLDEVCNKHFSTQSALNKHLKSPSHLKQLKLNELKETNQGVNEEDIKKKLKKEVTKNFYCPLCDFQTKNQFDYIQHAGTIRHVDNISIYKYNVKKIPDMYDNFIDDYNLGNIYIGIVKGKQITKKDIIEKYKIQSDKYVKYDERSKYGEKSNVDKEQKKKNENIKKLEDIINRLERKQKDYIKLKNKYDLYINNPEKYEAESNPDLLTSFKIHKKEYLEIDSLKEKLNKMKD